ncbi:ClpXP protease specificity-enhancing factor [Thiococcus pfennigii]|jgi:stringent starvation protein B|uniref:ClpXP protease specificity-enhancing factor n=1 Tax=Thiococcus pfennigii TaxID=1057 RepID=UPI00190325BD|nr:ClpXP protease specificity-enhancing factor [Thiococcus pfennigii]MBK1701605.1 ClpXP protease specificity-enhancing factor [Thiococcus pfennigii]
MTSNRPYLIRALYDWILDNQLTPHLLVDASRKDAQLPVAYAQDGKIVLNITPSAVRGLVLGNDRITFGARFGGVAMEVSLPVDAVIGIYARENGHGMLFPDEEPQQPADVADAEEGQPPPRERPTLKVVK